MKQSKKEIRSLILGQETVVYELERKAVKRMNLRVRRDGSIHISVPMRTPLSVAERFLREKADWLIAARARVLCRRPTPFRVCDGAVLMLEGRPCRIVLVKGKQGATRTDETLILALRDPTDETEGMRVLRRFIKAEAARVLTARVQAIYPHFAYRVPTFPTLSFRWMKSRWGSCTASKGHIALNEKLLLVDPALADYVICHEFCHFEHQDHSAAFYRHLSHFYPQYAAARRALQAACIPELTEEQ